MISFMVSGPVATITLDRPPVNAINEEWLDRFGAALDQTEARDDLSVLIIRSAQKVFCAGADLALMRSRFETVKGRNQMIAMVRRIQALYARIERSNLVSIAEIGGAAMGGGLELALACDLRVISKTAKVGLPEAALGLLPGAGGTQRMTARCGDDTARRLILGAEVVDGKTAQQLRVAQWCVSAAEIADFTTALSERVSAASPQALGQCKRCIGAVTASGVDGFEVEIDGTRALLESAETQRRVHKFLEK